MVESSALLKRRSPKGYRGFESLPHRHCIADLRFSILDLLRGRASVLSRTRRPESVIEDVIGHAATQGDPLGLVKGPVNAKINSALTVLFCGLRQSRKTARPIWPDISIVVAGLSVEFVGNERKRDIIGAVKPAHNFEERPSESSMTRRISGERRRKIRASEIAGGRA